MSTVASDPNVKPRTLAPRFDAMPDHLTSRHQWVGWRWWWDAGRGKWTKPPYRIDGKGHAKSNDPQTWAHFEDAVAAYERGGFDGVGFNLLGEDRIVGVDLDDVRDDETGVIDAGAMRIVRALNTYTEISPTGRGLRIFARGELPIGGRRKGAIEMYDAKAGRYLTVTGWRLP